MVLMKTIKKHPKIITMAFLLFLFSVKSFAHNTDIYLIFYATINGKSGHTGIAVDNYRIIVKDYYDENNERISVYDTIKDGTLTYYDVWPVKDDFNVNSVNQDYEPRYYKIPAASWENDITVNSLLKKGIPNEERYPVDGLIEIPNSPSDDYEIKDFIEGQIAKKRPFNVRDFNCADFVELIIEYQCACNINAEEYIFFKLSTTPNKLYQKVTAFENIKVIKDGTKKAKGSFTMERLLKRKKE